jgi:hypothetical protein
MVGPDAAFCVGQTVRVIANERNNTPRRGVIMEIIWHHKDARYNYYIQASGRKVSKRYFAEDLEAVEV